MAEEAIKEPAPQETDGQFIAELITRLTEQTEDVKGIQTYGASLAMLNLIVSLEKKSPSAKILPRAKLAWFLQGLTRFEVEFINPSIARSQGSQTLSVDAPEGLTMTWEMLKSHLTIGFLGKDGFEESHERVVTALRCLVDVTKGDFQSTWIRRLGDIYKMMIPQQVVHPDEKEASF